MRHETDHITTIDIDATNRTAPPQQPSADDRSTSGLTAKGVESLVGALFDGLSSDDREWVVQRINHYRALAAADQAPEGRF